VNKKLFEKKLLRSFRLAAVLLAASFVLLGAPRTAWAVPEVLEPPDGKPWFFQGAIGGAFHMFPGRPDDFRGRPIGSLRHQFKISEELGYHFSGEFEGPAIGPHFSQAFGNGFGRLTAAFKFWWDIQPKDDLALYIAPFGHAGYTGWFNGHWANTFNTQFGAEGRLILGQTGLVFLRAIAIDLHIGDAILAYDSHFTGYYDLMLGGGLCW